jgi:TonB family protein
MPITQIPFQDPVAPPEKPQPEQLGLYDSQGWETAYRDLNDDARVPHLLIQLQDDLARSRRREAAWISIIVHLILIIFIFNFERLEKHFPWLHTVVAVARANPTSGKNLTFLDLPPDLQKLPHKPNTAVIGDKDRIATTRHPELDPKELRKALASPPPGMPGLRGPQSPAPAQSSQGLAQNQPQTQSQQPPPPNQQTAQLQMPAPPNPAAVFRKYAAPGSVSSQIDQAGRAVAAGHGGQQGNGGDFGSGTPGHGRQTGNLEILSDTLGVDFGPYLQRIKVDIYKHWYEVMPPSVYPPTSKKGRLRLRFGILKDGSVADLHVETPSGDVALDRAAWGSITGSNPFPPLPPEFINNGGQYLELIGTFSYNLEDDTLE